MKTLKEVFDYYFKDVTFDIKFTQRVTSFIMAFLSKNNDHVEFFGSPLIGVNPVRWHFSDTDTWWDEIFDVPDNLIYDSLLKLPVIRKEWKVSSDPLNHAFIYCLYRVHHSKDIPEKEKEKCKARIMLAMNMKFLCSLMAHYFKYPADRGVAEKTFNKLTKRFDIKVLGSWGKMLVQRSEQFVAKGTRFYDTYVNYNDDTDIVKMVNEAQNRIRGTVKEITKVFHDTIKENAKVLSQSSTLDLDGVIVLKDIETQSTKYMRYIRNVLVKGDSYIKPELEQIVTDIVKSLNVDIFEQIQMTFINEYGNKKHLKVLDQLIEDVITYSLEILQNANIKLNDIGVASEYLKNNYMSGRSTHPILLRARNEFSKLVGIWDKKYKNTPLVPERCGFFLYLFLRTILMNHYK